MLLWMMSLCKLRSEIELLVEEYYMYDTRKFIQFKLIQLVSLVQMDATLLANNSQHCWMLRVASVCTPCCVLLGVVVQSLKLVKFLATWKRIQQRPTMLRPFALGYSVQELLSHATHLFRSPYDYIPNFCHFWLNSVTEYQPYPDLLCSALGSLRNDGDEGNKNVKIAVGLGLQNNNFARALRFFVYSYFEKCCR